MIISKLQGGLGNQMFQYAAARSLAIRHNTSVALDCSWFGDSHKTPGITSRQYELGVFNLKANNIEGLSFAQRAERRLRSVKIVEETGFAYDQGFTKYPNNVLLHGYWQSERYFRAVESAIRKDFSFKEINDATNLGSLGLIQEVESVSIHVRRGDYVSNKAANAVHGTSGIDYYNKAIKRILTRVPTAVFFVFSDDLDWCKSNIQTGRETHYINHNTGGNSYKDMWLMSNCRHNIIANSSFSWWGAWLNRNPEKIVYAPRDWFSDDTKDTRDIIPNDWVKV